MLLPFICTTFITGISLRHIIAVPLKSGDEVVTSGGIYGTITSVKEDRFVVRIGENHKVEVGKGFISTVVKKADAT